MNLDVNYVWVGVVVTALAIARVWWIAWQRHRDPFHPAFILGAPCLGAYVLQPVALLYLEAPQTLRFLKPGQLEFVVLVNGLGVSALLWATVLRGGEKWERLLRSPPARQTLLDQRKLCIAALTLGALGVGAFAYGIANVGGFGEAYGRSYGGGYSTLGYVRDAYWLCLPAIALLLIAGGARPAYFLPVCLFASPLFIHGLLGARRGPTAAVLICLMVAYGLSRRWRPKLWQFGLILGATGLLMLVIVANRNVMHLGTTENRLERGIESYATRAGSSNEFIYGGGTIVAARSAEDYYWGGRYATVLFVRPIPRALWPSKYAFAERFFGIPNLEKAGANFGTGGDLLARNLGWQAPQGAAPGLIADLWLEFSWGALAVLFLIGLAYNRAWHYAVAGDAFWGVAYSLMAAFSFYLVAQTLEAMLFRFMLTAGMTMIAWFYTTGRLPRLRMASAATGRSAELRL